MVKSLEKEFNFYIANRAELVKQYNDRFIVIKNQTVIGVYNSRTEAILETTKEHDIGTFLVQKCETGRESYTHISNPL